MGGGEAYVVVLVQVTAKRRLSLADPHPSADIESLSSHTWMGVALNHDSIMSAHNALWCAQYTELYAQCAVTSISVLANLHLERLTMLIY